jgi:predicted nucleic acid-binding protein
VIGYLDTSAFVPLIVAETSSESCRRFWDDADAVATSRLLYVETAAALAQARRQNRLNDVQHQRSLRLLEGLWSQVDVVEVDEVVARRAGVLAHELALRGYDAVHCASAEQLDDVTLVAASGDRRLLRAWSSLGLATYDTTA